MFQRHVYTVYRTYLVDTMWSRNSWIKLHNFSVSVLNWFTCCGTKVSRQAQGEHFSAYAPLFSAYISLSILIYSLFHCLYLWSLFLCLYLSILYFSAYISLISISLSVALVVLAYINWWYGWNFLFFAWNFKIFV